MCAYMHVCILGLICQEKVQKVLFQTLKMAVISQGQGSLRLNSQTILPLTSSNVPTSFRWNNQVECRFGEK